MALPFQLCSSLDCDSGSMPTDSRLDPSSQEMMGCNVVQCQCRIGCYMVGFRGDVEHYVRRRYLQPPLFPT